MIRAACGLLLVGSVCEAYLAWRPREASPERQQRTPSSLNLKGTFFARLSSYAVNAQSVKEEQYPWAARLVHSRTDSHPQMCTAVCIEERIFITAARCLYFIKANYTSILQMNERHPAQAFVLPTNSTWQAYDDIGFVVVGPATKPRWAAVPLTKHKRTDDSFHWFGQLNLNSQHHKVVGFVCTKELRGSNKESKKFVLSELSVIIGTNLCSPIMTRNVIQGYNVPCYHSCNADEFAKSDKKCSNYLAVEGAAVIDVKTQTLLGVATWGSYHPKTELPVGFSVPNSDNFFSDLTCARKIRDDKRSFVTAGHYQMLCDL